MKKLLVAAAALMISSMAFSQSVNGVPLKDIQ